MSDTQMVLPVEKVMYQAQEVAAVIATDRYTAADGVAAVEVDYDPLPVIVDPFKALEPGAQVLRTDKPDKKDNHIFHWEVGDRAATDKAIKDAAAVVKQRIYIPRIHVASIETCGCVASFNKTDGQLTVWMTTQAPHAIRTVFALVAGHVGLSEEDPDHLAAIGGGFGGKVPVYPGYVIAVAVSVVTGKPIKGSRTAWRTSRRTVRARLPWTRSWPRTRTARSALRIKTVADHGMRTSPPTRPSLVGLFSVVTGSYDIKNAVVEVDGAYTNKAPGGIAYRCSFRVTEAAHAIERMTDMLAQKLKVDAAEFRLKNFIPADRFPYKSALGWEYDSGNYAGALKKAMDQIGYAALRKEQAEKRAKGELMGIGISASPRSGAGPFKHFDILASRCSTLRAARAPTGKAIARFGTKSQGRGTRRGRADHRGRAGHPRRARAGRGGRHRHRALRPGTYASSTPAGRGWRDGGARCATRRARSRPTSWRSARRTSCGSREVLGEGRAREEQDDPGDRAAATRITPGWKRK